MLVWGRAPSPVQTERSPVNSQNNAIFLLSVLS